MKEKEILLIRYAPIFASGIVLGAAIYHLIQYFSK